MSLGYYSKKSPKILMLAIPTLERPTEEDLSKSLFKGEKARKQESCNQHGLVLAPEHIQNKMNLKLYRGLEGWFSS